jgi:hypothetical protein
MIKRHFTLVYGWKESITISPVDGTWEVGDMPHT